MGPLICELNTFKHKLGHTLWMNGEYYLISSNTLLILFCLLLFPTHTHTRARSSTLTHARAHPTSYAHIHANMCTEPQKHVRTDTSRPPHAAHWNVSVNGCIVRFGLPPLPHFFSFSWMHTHAQMCARTDTYTHTYIF